MAVSGPPPYDNARRARPRPVWFVVGGTLVVLGVVAFVALLTLTLSRSTHTDDVVRLDQTGQPVQVQVEAGKKRMMFVTEGQPVPRCTVTDAHGEPLSVDSPGTTVTVGSGGRSWRGFGSFTSSTASVRLSCADATPGQEIRVGAPLGAGFVGGILATILVALLLGGAGLLVLLVTTILWLTRPPRAA